MLKLEYKEAYGLKGIAIIAHPRSGSTSLFDAFSSHYLIHSYVCEPFNSSDKIFKHYRKFYERSEVSKFLRTLDLFKHLHCQENSEYILEDCRDDFDFVSMYRRNLLKSAVSWFLAYATGRWFPDKYYVDSVRDIGFEMDLFELEKLLNFKQEQRSLLQNIDSKVCIEYEDLYEVNDCEKLKKINEVYGALGYPPVDKLHFRLEQNQKQNNLETYKLVKNIDEVEREFGKEYGSLFE